MALSLVVITGFVGQVSVVQLALAGVAGFSDLASRRRRRHRLPAGAALAGVAVAVAARADHRGLGAARARREPAVVTLAAAVAIANFGFANPTWGGGRERLAGARPQLCRARPRADGRRFRGLDGNQPSPVFGWVALVATVALCLLVGYLRRATSGQRMLAVRSNERAAAGGRDQRPRRSS